jgi:hypothetical protein
MTTRKEAIKNTLDKVRQLWERYPSERLMQLLTNHTRVGRYVKGSFGPVMDPFHIQDEDLIDDIERELEK